MNKRFIMMKISILLTFIISFSLTGCEKQYFEENTELKVALENQVNSMDPAVAFNDESLTLIGQSYETLYQYHYLKRPYEITPLLAEELPKLTDGGKTYTIKIKQGVLYHDHVAFKGRKRIVIAQDFINQIKRLAFKPLKSTGRWLFENRIIGFDEFSKTVGDDFEKMLATEMKGLKALDDYTLEIRFKRNESIIPNFLTMNFVVPIPVEVLRYHKNDLSSEVIGTGPYVITKKEKDYFELDRFSHYRKDFYPSVGDRYANTKDLVSSSNEQIPFVDKIKFFVIVDAERRMDRFVDGELDFINIPKQFLEKFVVSFGKLPDEYENKNISLKHFASVSSDWLSFNMNDPLWGKNKNLRKAVAHAIDYEAYISEMTKGSNMRANSVVNPGISGYNPRKSMPYKFDLEKAKIYMTKAGFPKGKGLPEVTYSTRSDTAPHIAVGEFFKRQLARIGIKVKIEVLTFSEFLKRGRGGKLQLFLDRWIYDYPDAENLFQLLVSWNTPGINKSGFKNKRIDNLYYKYVSTNDEEGKVKIVEKFESVIQKELPWIMLSYYSSYILHHGDIRNLRKSSFIRNHHKYIKKKKN
jgi:oligopeptide transport system substrate-binding protein